MDLNFLAKDNPDEYRQLMFHFKDSALNGIEMAYQCKYHLFNFLKFTNDADLLKLDQYFDDFVFEDLHMKLLYGDFKGNAVTPKEINKLKSYVDDWMTVISKDNHKDELLSYISKETRDQLKNLKKDKNFEIGSSNYKNAEKKILMFSKKVAIKVKTIFKDLQQNEIKYNLNETEIYFTMFSMDTIPKSV